MKIINKIAIPTNDRKTIEKRTGPCNEFAIINVNEKNNKIIYLKNNHSHDKNTPHNHSHDEILKILKDVDLLVTIIVGKHLQEDLINNNVYYEKTDLINIEDIINFYKPKKEEKKWKNLM